jgi:hypothetical protein
VKKIVEAVFTLSLPPPKDKFAGALAIFLRRNIRRLFSLASP